MVLRYERLPNHCFKCGRVDHVTKECTGNDRIPVVNGIEKLPFGIWLRASGPFCKHYQRDWTSISFPSVNLRNNWRKLEKGNGGRTPVLVGREETTVQKMRDIRVENDVLEKIDLVLEVVVTDTTSGDDELADIRVAMDASNDTRLNGGEVVCKESEALNAFTYGAFLVGPIGPDSITQPYIPLVGSDDNGIPTNGPIIFNSGDVLQYKSRPEPVSTDPVGEGFVGETMKAEGKAFWIRKPRANEFRNSGSQEKLHRGK
ncbi:hypothetical protein LWI28_009288 [Acer negundo]|uniref:CCHC-type domain-containing protein n=1 Tax=Acer negundo TaxID=4023 RepID=A0AAD5P0C9_ACENE|nr:hypothetical protein LWI28_009288 [Acer negundo]